MTDPGQKENENSEGGVSGVGGPSVSVHHGSEVLPKIQTSRLVELHEKEGLDFPVDGDESSKRGGTAVGIIEEADK